MNLEQVLSILRQVLLFGGGFAVAKGWLDNTTLTTVVGAVITLASSFWAIYTRRDTGLVASAATVPQVTSITTNSATLAQAVPSDKVNVGAP